MRLGLQRDVLGVTGFYRGDMPHESNGPRRAIALAGMAALVVALLPSAVAGASNADPGGNVGDRLKRPGMSGESIRWKDHSHGTYVDVSAGAA